MGLFQIAHKNYSEFYTKDVWDEEKGRKIIEKGTDYFSEERLEYIHRFYECLLNSKKMNDLGIMYIRHSNLSVRDVVELYNRDKAEDKQLNENTGKSRIIACANKVNNSFESLKHNKDTKTPLEWIISLGAISEYNEKKMALYENCKQQIDDFIEMFDSSGKNKKEKMIIKMPAFAKVKELSEEDFNNFMDIIRPYSKREIDNVQKCLEQMRNEVGYFNFLMTAGVKLTEVDKERREQIIRWLGLETEGSQPKDTNSNYWEDGVEI